VEQITEDFLRLLVAHVISEAGGQPTKGWVFSVPQCYSVTDVQRYRGLIQKAGAIGPIHIYGESDSVVNASMEWIKNFTCAEQQAAFKQDRNFSVAAAVCDFGDGTTVRITNLKGGLTDTLTSGRGDRDYMLPCRWHTTDIGGETSPSR
jgi:hypothetical protein